MHNRVYTNTLSNQNVSTVISTFMFGIDVGVSDWSTGTLLMSPLIAYALSVCRLFQISTSLTVRVCQILWFKYELYMILFTDYRRQLFSKGPCRYNIYSDKVAKVFTPCRFWQNTINHHNNNLMNFIYPMHISWVLVKGEK